MKGIILAGGKGVRLYPMTLATCKQLLPIYDKPMIYYPLSVLMLAGIQDILIISTPEDLPRFGYLLKDGEHLGLSISYAAQAKPEGIAQAFLIGERFIGKDPVTLILGDNIFYGHHLREMLAACQPFLSGAHIFGYQVKDPERYGVLAFDENNQVAAVIEKPKNPPSPYAVTGLYFYDNHVIDIAKSLRPSPRGELEITDVNQMYLQEKTLRVSLFERGFAWLDTGTPEALQQASAYVQAIQERQGIKIACIEEIAYDMGYINEEQFERLIVSCGSNEYSAYLRQKIMAVRI
jgi:glucose-1-phosphate thymidylyltransferase